MNNTGTNTWTTDATPHNLGSQNPQDNTRWGFGRVGLPGGTPVALGSSATFSFTATAPAIVGSYPFDWKMVEDGIEWFGATCQETINVIAAPLPDLVTNHQTIAINGTLTAGNNITFTSTVKNDSSVPAAAGSIGRWCIDNPNCLTTTTNEINTHSFFAFTPFLTSNLRTSSGWTATAGPHDIWWCADVTNFISESNEGIISNCTSRGFTVGATPTFTLGSAGGIEVSFSPALTSESTETTLSVNPTGGFNSTVTFSVIDILNSSGTSIGLSGILGFIPSFTPTTLASPYTGGSVFSVTVDVEAADPDNDQLFTLVIQGSGGGKTATVNVPLTLKASNPIFEEE